MRITYTLLFFLLSLNILFAQSLFLPNSKVLKGTVVTIPVVCTYTELQSLQLTIKFASDLAKPLRPHYSDNIFDGIMLAEHNLLNDGILTISIAGGKKYTVEQDTILFLRFELLEVGEMELEFWDVEINEQAVFDTENGKLLIVDFIDEQSIPNVISCNGDGINDDFTLSVSPETSITIYNKYGQIVYHSKGHVCWNGKGPDNRPQPRGLYYYQLIQEEHTIKGTVTLLR